MTHLRVMLNVYWTPLYVTSQFNIQSEQLVEKRGDEKNFMILRSGKNLMAEGGTPINEPLFHDDVETDLGVASKTTTLSAPPSTNIKEIPKTSASSTVGFDWLSGLSPLSRPGSKHS
jgi:hypothetical protein